MLRVIWIGLRTLVSALRSRHQLILENMVLRQQLAAFCTVCIVGPKLGNPG